MIVVFQKTESLGLPRFPVTDHIEVKNFAVLAKDADYVAFGELVWETADIDVSAVFEVVVPVPLA